MTQTKLERKTLKEWRDDLGLTQRGLSRFSGINEVQYWKLEKGYIPLTDYYREKVAEALELEPSQIAPSKPKLDINPDDWPDDGLRRETPIQTLKWWRERRGITQAELAAFSHIGFNTIKDIEQGTAVNVRPATRRRLARALRVAIDKIAFPGDGKRPSSEKPLEELLREELRAARYALRKAHDFMRDDSHITFQAQAVRDRLLPDIQRELRGT